MNDTTTHNLLEMILASINRMETFMADISTDITNLVAAVTAITSDVAAVLAALKTAPNITSDQVAALEGAITNLQSVDASLKAAVPPAPQGKH